jgi:integrase
MNERTGACPKCGRAQCHIVLHWQGYTHRLFKDVRDVGFGYLAAYDQLFAMNRDIREKKFNIVDWQPEKVKERRLDMMLDRWLEQKKSEVESNELSYGTLHAYRSYVYNHISPRIGHLDVRSIRFSDLEEFKDSLPKSLKIKTKRTIMNDLHTALKWMWRKGAIDAMPPFPVVKGNDSEPRIALSFEDQHAALALIPEKHRDVFEFENETGLRPGETCSLKIKDVDFSSRTLQSTAHIHHEAHTRVRQGRT